VYFWITIPGGLVMRRGSGIAAWAWSIGDDARCVHVEAVPMGTLGHWARFEGHNRFVVADTIAAGSVAAVVRHLRGHATVEQMDALAVLTCSAADCAVARDWLAAPLSAAVPASSA
jgi:hypothetical protein